MLADRGETIVARAATAERCRRQASASPPARHRPRSGARLTVTRLRRIGADMSTQGDLRPNVRATVVNTTTRSANGRDSLFSFTADAGRRRARGGSGRHRRGGSRRHGSRASHRADRQTGRCWRRHIFLRCSRPETSDVELRYDVYCARSEADAETPCAVDGTVFARAGDTGAYREIDVREERGASGGRFVAQLPESIARAPRVSRTTRCFGATRPTWSQRFRQEVRLHPSGACRWAGASGSRSAPTSSATSVKRPSASSTLRGAAVRRKSVSSRAGTSCRSAARHSTSITTARWSCWTRRTSVSFAGGGRRSARRRAARHQRDAGGHVDR